MRALDITARTGRDIAHTLDVSLDRYGAAAAIRYENLIGRAFEELRDDPMRPGSKVAGRRDLRLDALRHPARRQAFGHAVRATAHIVVYLFDDESVQIVRLLHEATNLPARLQGRT